MNDMIGLGCLFSGYLGVRINILSHIFFILVLEKTLTIL